MKLTRENFKFGSDKVRIPMWDNKTYFIPYFLSGDIVHGLNQENTHQAWSVHDSESWHLYTPPTPEKKFEKRVMYKRIVIGSVHDKVHWETQNMYKTKEEAMDNIHTVGYIEQEVMVEVKE